MKKLLTMAVMAATVITASAQDDLVKAAKKLLVKKDYAGAVQTLTPALTSDATTDKVAAQNLLQDIYYAEFSVQQDIMIRKQIDPTLQIDSLTMYTSLYNAIEAAIKTCEMDAKNKYFSKAKDRYANLRIMLIQGGQYFYDKNDEKNAAKYWGAYVDTKGHKLFPSDVADPYVDQMSYYAALLSYQTKDYQNAKRYGEVAAQTEEFKEQGTEVLIFSMRDACVTPEDTVAYISKVKQMHAADPKNERYYNMLQTYYVQSGRDDLLAEWIADEMKVNPNNKMTWALKGIQEMNANKWEEAIASFKKSAEIDPEFIQAVFNCGTCLYNKARDLQDELSDKTTGKITKENDAKVKAVLEEAQTWLEKSQQLDPAQEIAKWAYPLSSIYYALGKTEKSEQLQQLIGQ